MFCPSCGTSNTDSARFCLSCGQPLSHAALPPRAPFALGRVSRPLLLAIGGIIGLCLVLSICAVGTLVLSSGTPTPGTPGLRTVMPSTTSAGQPTVDLLDSDDYTRLREIARAFGDPRARREITETVRIADLLARPSAFANGTVRMTVRVSRRIIIYNLLPSGWLRSYVLFVDDRSGTIPVLYRGYGEQFQPGDTVAIIGVFSPSGRGILADAIESADWMTVWLGYPVLTQIILVVAALGGLALGVAAVGILARRKRAARLLMLSVLLFTLSGCRMDISTIIHADGTGAMNVRFAEATENVDFLRQMPNMADYFRSWISDLRMQGMMVDESRQGQETVIFIQNRFASLDALATPLSGQEQDALQTWVYATRDDVGVHTTYRFSGAMDTTVFYRAASGIDSRAQAEVRKQLDQMSLTYSVTLPGKIVYSNADMVVGNRMTWKIKMNARNEMQAESRLEVATQADLFRRVATAIGAMWAFSLVLTLYAAIAYRRKAR